MNKNELNRVYIIIDLSIHFEYDLSFKINYKLKINKFNKLLGFININTRICNNSFCLRTLYCSLVRSSIELASLI